TGTVPPETRGASWLPLPAPPEKCLQGIVDRLPVGDFGEREVLVPIELPLELADKRALAVVALHLPVAEEVHAGQELLGQKLHARGVVFSPIVAVGEVKKVDVPVRRMKRLVDQPVAHAVRRRDASAARLARVVAG